MQGWLFSFIPQFPQHSTCVLLSSLLHLLILVSLSSSFLISSISPIASSLHHSIHLFFSTALGFLFCAVYPVGVSVGFSCRACNSWKGAIKRRGKRGAKRYRGRNIREMPEKRPEQSRTGSISAHRFPKACPIQR